MSDGANTAPVIDGGSVSNVSSSVENSSSSAQSSSQASPVIENSSASVNASQQAGEQTQSKRLYEREEVNRIAAHAAAEREAKIRAEFERNKQYSTPQSLQTQQGAQSHHSNQSAETNANVNSVGVTRQHIQQIAFEERMMMEADSLKNKLIESQSRYTDFATVTDVLDDLVTDHTAPVFNGLDNAADVIYELGKHPERIPPQLFELARDPFNVNNALRARRALDAISQQMKSNAAAKNMQIPKAPIEHEKPTIAGMDSGVVTVADLRKSPKYKA